MKTDRRRFLLSSMTLAAGSLLPSLGQAESAAKNAAKAALDLYPISLAQWSLHRALRKGELDHLDYPGFVRKNFNLDAIEWVNQFFHVDGGDLGFQPKPESYLAEMKKRAEDHGITSVLIMCDRVGNLGDSDATKRTKAVEGHYAWLDAAKYLGCHSIRVNSSSNASLSPEAQSDLCADGLRRLSVHAATLDLNVIVENHGGLSSNGAWLANVLKKVNMENCGSLPDYGNFHVARNRGDAEQYAKAKALYAGDPVYQEDEKGLFYDRYQGMIDLMPYAKGVSAKSHDFDANGDEIHTDFAKMQSIIKDSGYTGHIGIEYEGSELSEVDGIQKTIDLLKKVISAS